MRIDTLSARSCSGCPAREDASHFAALDCVQTPVLVIGADYRILGANRAAVELGGIAEPESLIGTTCFAALVSRTTPCDHCPIEGEKPLAGVERSFRLNTASGEVRYLKESFAALGDTIALTLTDVTREILALKKADLSRKEALAKRTLIERLRKEDSAEKSKIANVLDELPDALLIIDGNHRIVHMNKAARGISQVQEPSRCHEALRRSESCSSCPVKDVIALDKTCKISHLIEGEYYTERITPLRDSNGAVIIVRNTTREIQLIEKIREQQKTIAKTNEILSSLVRLGGAMQTEEDPEPVTHLFLELFLSAAGVTAASIVVLDKRASNVWFSATTGFDAATMHDLIKTCLSERRSRKLEPGIHSESPRRPGIVAHTIRGSDEQQVGCAFWIEPLVAVDQQLISLFFEPFGAFIHSHLLMRLLEEKANRDPLTGTYNRGYLSSAIEEEHTKYALYEIPYAIVVADINGLKQLNDQHGHEAGDKIIIEVATRLRSAIRETDVLARIGGDEFVLLLTNATQSDAESFVARIQGDTLLDAHIELTAGVRWPVAVSLGACGVDQASPADLIKIADQRMYDAKSKYYAARARYR